MTANLEEVGRIVQRMEKRSKDIDASLKVANDWYERSFRELRDAVAQVGKARKSRYA